MTEPLDIFKALADEVRLRILHAIMQAELSVAELVSVMKLPQSTVSRHLKPLRDAGLVDTRRDGTSVYYRKGEALADAQFGGLLEERLSDLPTAKQDLNAVRQALELRRRRSREFFDKVAGQYSGLTQPGGGWQALAAALAAGFAGRNVADLGSGEGALTLLLARFAAEVVAVDQSPAMLREVRREAKRCGVAARVKVAEGDLEKLPLGEGSVDAAFLSQALHHAARPEAAVREAARIVRPGGQLVILDLLRHDQEWVRDQLADQWLGFDKEEIAGWLKAAGLRLVASELIDGGMKEFKLLLMVGIKKSSET